MGKWTFDELLEQLEDVRKDKAMIESERDQLREKLAKTEEDLQRAKNRINALFESMKAIIGSAAKLEAEKVEAETKLNELVDENFKLATKYDKAESQKAAAIEILIESHKRVLSLECECDEYYGFTCGKHSWSRELLDMIEKLTGRKWELEK